MKLIGIDYGQVRTGLAATDPDNILAYPLTTLDFSRFLVCETVGECERLNVDT